MPEIKSETKKPTCFVIMPFSDPEGYEPGHFRSVYEYTFKPAIEAAGYTALRIDDNSVSNLIHGKMMNELVTAPMVLCDLSTNNPNVLYELGIRHAFDKPVVLVQEIGQNRIFDIAGITSVEYHPTRRYEETVIDQEKIREAIIQTAEAKSKYSIMSMVALQSAKPIDTTNISAEQQNTFLLQQMMQKISSLEAQIKRPQADKFFYTLENYDDNNKKASERVYLIKVPEYESTDDMPPFDKLDFKGKSNSYKLYLNNLKKASEGSKFSASRKRETDGSEGEQS